MNNAKPNPAALKSISRESLDKLVDQTEITLSELKSELARRDEAAQEREVANLDEHMKNAELSLKTIRDFLSYLKEEFSRSKR